MLGVIATVGPRFGIIRANGKPGDEDDMSFVFSPGNVIGTVRLGDLVDYWLDDNPSGGLCAVEVQLHDAGMVHGERVEFGLIHQSWKDRKQNEIEADVTPDGLNT